MAAVTTPIASQDDSERPEAALVLPLSNVEKIMRSALPAEAKLSKVSKELIRDCATEFISFITSQAGSEVVRAKRRAINGEDILDAMQSLGLDSYAQITQIYLAKLRTGQQTNNESNNGD